MGVLQIHNTHLSDYRVLFVSSFRSWYKRLAFAHRGGHCDENYTQLFLSSLFSFLNICCLLFLKLPVMHWLVVAFNFALQVDDSVQPRRA